MSEKIRKNIIYSILVIAVIWGVFNMKKSPSKADVEQPKTISRATSSPIALKKPFLPEIQRLENEAWGTDPFRTKVTRARGPQLSWDLSGIMYNATSPFAYINRKPARIGDTVNQARVVNITKDYVTMEYNGKQFKLYVNKG